jgi:4-amino-4-deoxy-L-arabinose transferase-like glycosyltransferase
MINERLARPAHEKASPVHAMRWRLVVPQPLVLFAIVVTLRLVLAFLVPIFQDETYYLAWATAPDLGYFDHPPAIAWIAATGMLSWGSVLAARLGTMLVAALAFPFVSGLLARAGIYERRARLAGLLLFSFNFFGFGVGILTTPDVALITAWCAALHEGATALTGQRHRWIGAGIAVGLGLLSKYSMMLIAPVFFWALWRGDRKGLRTPWPWLGGLVAVLLFAPHIVWNAHNQWVPIRFQLAHGFKGRFDESVGLTTRLPWAQPPGEQELFYGRWLSSGAPRLDVKPKPTRGALERSAEYFALVAAIWGAFLVPMAQVALGALPGSPRAPDPINHSVRPLLVAAAVVPVVFFGLVNLHSPVEPNWPAVYFVAAAVLLATSCGGRLRVTIACSVVNAVLVLTAGFYTRVPVGAAAENRVLSETRGYRELAAWLEGIKGPIFADRHQLIAELNYHAPRLAVRQWPGISRPSEYLRRPEWTAETAESVRAAGRFWLVAFKPIPPHLPGFQPVEAFAAHECQGTGLVMIRVFSTATFEQPCPGHTVHQWIVVRYEPAAGAG